MENVIVADYGHVELVDYGGVTAVGKSIRQFTEIYDRGYWNAGSRAADASMIYFLSLCCACNCMNRRDCTSLPCAAPAKSFDAMSLAAADCDECLAEAVCGWLAASSCGSFADAA